MNKSESTSEWRAGWRVLLASMVGYGNGMGLFLLSSSLFIAPVKTTFHWSTEQALIAPIASLTMAFLFPFIGRLIDRWGARPFAVGGLSGLVVCYLALASCPDNVVFYRGLALIIGVCNAACGPLTFARGVGSWFKMNRGTALGILISGLSIGGLVGIPFASYLIKNYGWRGAYVGLATSIVVLGLPLVFMFFRERDGAPSTATRASTGNTLREALSDSRFWILLSSFVFAAIPIGMFSNHMVPVLTGRGFPLQEAVALGTIFAGSIGIARIFIGILVDRLRDYLVAATCLMAAGVGAFTLFHPIGSDPLFEARAMVFLLGLAYGAEGDLAAYFALKHFGMKAFSAIMGCFAAAIGLGTAAGGFIASIVVDHAGRYDPLAPFLAISLLVSGLLMLVQQAFHKPRVVALDSMPSTASR